MLQTIAFFDVVGIKEALECGDAASLLDLFWSTADAWTNGGVARSLTSPALWVRVRTFSDSAVLTTQPEPSIEDFHKVAQSLKDALDRRGLKSYVVIGRGEMIDTPQIPAMGAHLANLSQERAYENIIGSGETWINLFLGDRCVAETKEWHSLYSVYAVGEATIPNGVKCRDFREFVGFQKHPVKVFALR